MYVMVFNNKIVLYNIEVQVLINIKIRIGKKDIKRTIPFICG